jgi:hypothetical protein
VNSTGGTVVLLTVDTACMEAWAMDLGPGATSAAEGLLGQGFIVRDSLSLEPLLGFRLGDDNPTLPVVP